MAWIESHEEIGDHRKTLRLCQQLLCNVPTAVGYVHLLWHYTLKVAWADGNLAEFTPKVIERACWWTGDEGGLIKALQASGYMDGMKIHEWRTYAKHIIYQRKYNDRRKKENTAFLQSQNRRKVPVVTAQNTSLPDLTIPNHKNIYMDKFVKPTPEDVTAYAKSIDFPLNGCSFCDFYESKGWRVGRNPMKDWKAAVRTWKTNGYNQTETNTGVPSWVK